MCREVIGGENVSNRKWCSRSSETILKFVVLTCLLEALADHWTYRVLHNYKVLDV